MRKTVLFLLVFIFSFTGLSQADQVDSLIKLLHEGEIEKKIFAATKLSKIGDERAISPLIAALKIKNNYLRSYLIQSLTSFGAKALPLLHEATKAKKSRVKGNVANILGKIGDARSVPYLLTALKDKKRFVRKNAIIALGHYHSPEIMKALAQALEKEKKASNRRYLVEALGAYKMAFVHAPLKEALKDSDPFVRKNAIRAMGEQEDPALFPHIIDSFNDSDEDIQITASEVLKEQLSRNRKYLPELLKRLKDEKEKVRFYVAEILGFLKVPESLSALLTLLEREEFPEVQEAAVVALGEIGEKKALSSLIKIMESPEDGVRLAAVEALGKIGGPEAGKALAPVIWDYNEHIRVTAVLLLGDLGNGEGVAALEELIEKEKKESLKKLATRSLERLRKKLAE